MYASDPAALTDGRAARSESSDRPPEPTDPLLDRVGDTPLLPLRSVARSSSFELWGKAEFLNPTGSVKDRAALGIVRDAYARGRLGTGRTLLDASSGNTAVAYAMLGARLGFPVALVLPRNASPDRVARIRGYGAEIVYSDPLDGTDGAQREARRIATAEPDRYFYPDQYNNPANPNAHYRSTGPEIWRQTSGRVTRFVAGVGTGGTISGAGRYLKEQNPRIEVVGVEPASPIHGLEGLKHLPTALRPSTYDAAIVDRTIRVETEDAQRMVRRLAAEEGLVVGASAGAAVHAALSAGADAPGAVVVTILPDGGSGRPEERG